MCTLHTYAALRPVHCQLCLYIALTAGLVIYGTIHVLLRAMFHPELRNEITTVAGQKL